MQIALPRRSWRAIAALWLAVLAAACTIPISYYDSTTYRTLTDLKVDATELIGSFDSATVRASEPAIGGTRNRLLKAVEYEKGKGKDNNDTAKQLGLILEMYDRDIALYRSSGPNPRQSTYRELAIQLGQAFDIAIATEASKNKDQ